MKIVFGTDGWRGVIARDFTFENVGIVAQGIANEIKRNGKNTGVLVGYDTRFLSREFAVECAEVLASNRVKVFFSKEHAPTPVVSFGVKTLNLDGGIMVTASHNPFRFNGIKFKGAYGGPALPSTTMKIEKDINSKKCKPKKKDSFDDAVDAKRIEFVNLKDRYFETVSKMINLSLLRSQKRRVVVDSMHGAGSGYLDNFLSEVGWEVIPIRKEINPSFLGFNPEPCPPNTEPLVQAVLEKKADMGFALDGDADRIGAVDEAGNFVDSHRIFALLLRYLVEVKKWKGDVARTITVSNMIDRLSEKYERKLHITPVGFKHICKLMLEGNILIGGEESGGIGIARHLPERDSILNALLLSEMCIQKNTGLHNLISDLFSFIGFHTFKRVDIHLSSMDSAKKFLKNFNPRKFAGIRVRRIDLSDGLKFFLEDGSWLMTRLSGTEPVLRIYCESDSEEKIYDILEEMRKLVPGHL